MMDESPELRYKAADENVYSMSLEAASHAEFEDTLPFRKFPTYREQKNMPGHYWFATTGRHILYESRLEMRVLMMLDFDFNVSNVFAQPFELVLPNMKDSAKKKPVRHVPDFFIDIR